MKSLISLALLLAAIITASPSDAQAGNLFAMTCVKNANGTFLIIGIKTGNFPPSGQKILQYDVVVGKLSTTGEVGSEKEYDLESNLKIFATDADAREYVNANPVVITLSKGKSTDGVIVVNLGKKTATYIDSVYENIEELPCLSN